MDDLGRRALTGLAKFQIALAAMIFLPAWSLLWPQGWTVWALYLVCSALPTLYFLRRSPDLVRRRLGVGPLAEKEASQKRIQLAASIFVGLVFVVPALDRNFGWSSVPAWLVLAGDAGIILAFAEMVLVFRENEFAAATVGVDPKQRVVSTGPYALVRHPMYTGTILLFAATPLALGSWWGLIPASGLCCAIVWRLLDEEAYLARNLPGYSDYLRRVPARLMPGIW
jgi:protein-S-isoprenylcysteine O-methyltransferase Ste14